MLIKRIDSCSEQSQRKSGPVMVSLSGEGFQLSPFTFHLFWGYCSRKEVFQPHLPVRLPCYDLAPVTGFTLGRSLRLRTSGTPSFHGLTGGVYKARERIHRSIADLRLLANPTSRGRVADPDPNCEQLFEIGIRLHGSCPLYCPL